MLVKLFLTYETPSLFLIALNFINFEFNMNNENSQDDLRHLLKL